MDFRHALSGLPNFPENGKFRRIDNYFWGVAIGKKIFDKALKQIGSGKIVLEVGADWCWASRKLAKAENQVIALDINFNHLAESGEVEKNRINLTRICGQMDHLPLRDDSVDVIIGIACVHHSANLVRTFKEFARVLRPRGKLMMLREPISGTKSNQSRFGKEEKERGINENAPALGIWEEALNKNGFRFKFKIAKLDFLLGGFSIRNFLRLLKRDLIALSIMAIFLQDIPSPTATFGHKNEISYCI